MLDLVLGGLGLVSWLGWVGTVVVGEAFLSSIEADGVFVFVC